MYFTTSTFIASIALLGQLAPTFALPAPQRTITKVETITLQRGQQIPTPVAVQRYKVDGEAPKRTHKYTHKKVVQVARPKKIEEVVVPDKKVEQPAAVVETVPQREEPKKEEPKVVEPPKEVAQPEKVETPVVPKKEVDAPKIEEKVETPPTTTTTSGGPSDATLKKIHDLHNTLRAKHGVDPLTWDDEIAAHAANDNTAIGSCEGLEHTDHTSDTAFGAGENLGDDSRGAGAQTVQAWYDEWSLYDYASGGFAAETGHFTQVVWKGTDKLGCALGCEGKRLRCQYKKPGNYLGEFQKNVFPATS